MSFTEYLNANHYMNEGLIRLNVSPDPSNRTPKEWMQQFLDVIGHPEKHFPALHIAGTSGKGSIAIFAAEILRAHGLKVGLHISPYLQSATEKLWIDGHYVTTQEFTELVNWIKPYANRWKGGESPIHGMAWVAITLEFFRRQKVDIAVVEAGVGGRNDITNVLNTVTAVIGALGLDHTKTLGNTLEEIAHHKVGIAKRGIPLVVHNNPVMDVIQSEVNNNGAVLSVVSEGNTYRRFTDDPQDNRFAYLGKLKLDNLFCGMSGSFQTMNAALAINAVENTLDMLGIEIKEEAIRTGLEKARLPARLEVMKRRPRVILDGAHNPQKLEASLKVLCADRFRGKLIAIIGQLASRNPDEIATIVKQYCKHAVVTEPSVYAKRSLPAEELVDTLSKHGIECRLARTPKSALEIATGWADGDDRILVTGSIYLAGEMRELWYPLEKIVMQETSWPKS